MGGLTRIHVRNYRALADVELNVGPINVVFGPNGAGKSTLLDALQFFRDCAIRGVETASSQRDDGIGMLWDGAAEDQRITVELDDGTVSYRLSFVLAAGRIDPFPGERLLSSTRPPALIDRRPGSDKANLFDTKNGRTILTDLREPEKLSLGLFLDLNPGGEEAGHLDRLLHLIRSYHSRSFNFGKLKRSGSQSSPQTRLRDDGDNAWSVFRSLQDKRYRDNSHGTIMRYMADAFPVSDDIVLEQTGPLSVSASTVESGRRGAISASEVSDGYLQLLLLLLALFSEGPEESVLLFDEPEISLHPWAIVVFARAVKLAAEHWHKQVFVATHSPVLISQFDPRDILVAGVEDGRARFDRLAEIDETRDLLKDYAPGALYMSQAVAAQGPTAFEE